MAIYQEDEYKEVIRRVKQKIAELKIEIGVTLSEEEISRFEKQCHIRLPKHTACFCKKSEMVAMICWTVFSSTVCQTSKKGIYLPRFYWKKNGFGKPMTDRKV